MHHVLLSLSSHVPRSGFRSITSALPRLATLESSLKATLQHHRFPARTKHTSSNQHSPDQRPGSHVANFEKTRSSGISINDLRRLGQSYFDVISSNEVSKISALLDDDNLVAHLPEPWHDHLAQNPGAQSYITEFWEPLFQFATVHASPYILMAGEYDPSNPEHNPGFVDVSRVFMGDRVGQGQRWISATGNYVLSLNVQEGSAVERRVRQVDRWLQGVFLNDKETSAKVLKHLCAALLTSSSTSTVVLYLRFGFFGRVNWDGTKLVEIFELVDVYDFVRQLLNCGDVMEKITGWKVLGKELAPVPGPHAEKPIASTSDAVSVSSLPAPRFESRFAEDPRGAISLNVVERMCYDGLRKFAGAEKEDSSETYTDGNNNSFYAGFKRMGMSRYWDVENMIWYGPGAIGTAKGLKEFEQFHQIPFLRGFPDRKGAHHFARLGYKQFVASGGWPSVYATHAGDYLGIAATQHPIQMRCMDWWTCEGKLIVENWVFLDMIYIFSQIGLDFWQAIRTALKVWPVLERSESDVEADCVERP